LPRNEQLFPLKNFKGINRRDGAEKADPLEFLTTQNLWQIDKGVWSMIYGSTSDLSVAEIPGCRKITAIHRHPAAPCSKSVLYHCEPTTTPLSTPGSGGLTIAEVTSGSGTIFDSLSAVVSKKVWFCFSYCGMGTESAWDTRARPGFTPYVATPIDAWDVGGLQSFTLAANTNKLNVTHPTAFPSDVRSVNVFMAMSNASDLAANRRQLAYVGTIHSTSETLSIDVSIGPRAAAADSVVGAQFQTEAAYDANGHLPSGQYYVAVAYVVEGSQYDGLNPFVGSTNLGTPKAIQLTGNNNSIGVHYYDATGKSASGATHCYVFMGVRPHTEAPMTCVGTFRLGTTAKSLGSIDTFVIKDIPYNTNAATYRNYFRQDPHMYSAQIQLRSGFMVKKDADRPVTISEVFPSRSYWSTDGNPFLSADYLYMQLRTPFDLYFNGTTPVANPNIEEPSMVYFDGLSYIANGRDFLVTDGISISLMTEASGCVIPTAPNRLGVIKNQLVCTTAEQKGVIYGSNALAANNWSDGGTGTTLKFAILGDAFDQQAAGFGVLGYTDGIEGPRTLLAIFKKNSCWSLSSIPDAAFSINATADQLSGRVGCLAWKTITQTKVGMLFLGSDANIYLLRAGSIPFPIGGRVFPLLKHLVENDTLMKKCSAVYHDNHWKLAYPSSATSTYCDAELWADLRTEDGSPIIWVGPHAGREIGCQLVLTSEGDDHSRLGALVTSGAAARLDDPSATQNLGVDITMVLEWTLRRFNSAFNIKKYKGVLFEAYYDSLYQQQMLIEGFADSIYTQQTVELSPGDVNGEALWRDHEIYFSSDNLIGKKFKFRLTHTGKPLSISEIGIPWKPERRVTA
jgi:hypothetical protein